MSNKLSPRPATAYYKTCTAIAIALLSGCYSSGGSSSTPVPSGPLSQKKALVVEQFCGNCHPNPGPASFPKANWPEEVEQGFNFYYGAGRSDLQVPLMVDAIQYFQSQAPEKIELPTVDSFPTGPTSTKFEPGPLILAGDKISLTSDIKWDQPSQSVFFSDMANAKLRRLSLPEFAETRKKGADELVTLTPSSVVSDGNHPCKMNSCDWNGDGIRDYMIAEIGSTIISDQKLGSIAVYLGQSDNSFQRVVLAEGLARPVEAVPFDYDEDGDLDVLVAEFGYIKEGCLSLLRNQTNKPMTTSARRLDVRVMADNLQYEVIDPRHGHLTIIVVDIDKDSKLDIITALGQEYETVQVRINAGEGRYDSYVVTAMPDPAYNTSSIQAADVDGDGLIDLVHTCGDIFDSFVPKPYHGVRWLRNLGNKSWETHELGMLIGAMQSAIVDFDGDGDLDIAAAGLFPLSNRDTHTISLDSICWWEQQPGFKFVRHSVERDHSLHATCIAQDLNGDNRPEIIVGEWAQGQTPASLRVYWNTKQ